MNQSLYLFSDANSSLVEMGNLLAGGGMGIAGGSATGARGLDVALRLELWRKGDPNTGAPESFVATIAEYLSSEVELGDLSRGASLRVDLGGPSGGSLQVQASWGSGASFNEAPADSDGDSWPNPFDNCLNEPNDQMDTDADQFGNRCDADYDNDGEVAASDVNTLRRALGQVCGGSSEPDPDLDSNDDCVIDEIDKALLEEQFGGPPGPSGVICSPGQGHVCPSPLPEPGGLTLLSFGLAGLAALHRHRRHGGSL